MRQLIHRRRLTHVAMAVAVLAAGTSAWSAGFQLNESSGSGLGNAYAGGAAVAEDASTLWSNVAGLSRLGQRQGVVVLHLITPSIKFRDGGSARAAQQPLGGLGGDAGGLNVVPGTYLAMPLGRSMTAGLGISAPWGLVTEYNRDWIGRFQGVKSSIQTLNLNPGVAWRVSPEVSIGVGFNAQRMVAEFTSQVNYSAALLQAAVASGIAPGSATFNGLAAATAGLESSTSVKGTDTAYGWNIGVLWTLDPAHRIGAHLRSAVKYSLDGKAVFVHPNVPAVASALAAGVNSQVLYNSAITSQVKLPSIVNLSWFGQLSREWDLMADAQWTEWSTIQNLTFVRDNGRVLQSTPENFKDSWKLSVGANYRPGGPWMWRGGLALDKSPVTQADRTVRLPDANRTWLSGGAQYTVNRNLKLDLGATYIVSRKATINNSVDPATALGFTYGRVTGHYDANTVIVSGQAALAF